MSHPLDGCRAKLGLAKHRLDELESAIQAFGLQMKGSLSSDYDTVRRTLTVRFADIAELPVEWSIMTGEIVHHLRSTLDHLAWQLVLANRGNPTKRTQFPVYDLKQPYSDGSGRYLVGMSASAGRRIASHQPFNESPAKAHPLWMLQELNNFDKHRLLIVIASVFDSITGGGIGGHMEFDPPANVPNGAMWRVMAKTPFRNGEVLFQLFDVTGPAKLQAVDLKLNVQIVIGEVGPFRNQRLHDLLATIASHVAALIDDFEAEF